MTVEELEEKMHEELEEKIQLIEQYADENNDEYSESCKLLAICAQRNWEYLHGGDEIYTAVIKSVNETYEYLTENFKRTETIQTITRTFINWEEV